MSPSYNEVAESSREGLPKVASGIQGLDEITGGGLPKGRPTLVCGGAGCGKTLLAMEFLVRGAVQYGEPGVFMCFEESIEELSQNVKSLGFDLDDLMVRDLLAMDYVHVERSEIQETGEYDLEGLFIRLGLAIDSIGAKRVVLDTIETLFSGVTNTAILRSELRRLFRWLKTKGVTAIITGERGEGTLTRQGLEEYVSDCVILLDHRIMDQLSTRRMRVVKYRGTTHGANEYPFLIEEDGISVLPITSVGLTHDVTEERVSTGVPRLDAMLNGTGYYRGSTVMVSGSAGTGKTSLGGHLVDSACGRGERCCFFTFEESPKQMVRNARSIGIDLQQWVDKDLLQIHASRSTMHGLEMHLVRIHKLVKDFRPQVVVIDPLSNFLAGGSLSEVRSLLLRLIDFLKSEQITAFFTALTPAGGALEQTMVDVSSIIDTWILLRDIELAGERNRGLYILKSRGMAHSHQIREFVLTDNGVDLLDVYSGPEGVLTGSLRIAQEAREKAEAVLRSEDAQRKQRELERRRRVVEAQIAGLRSEFEALEEESRRLESEASIRETVLAGDRAAMAKRRGGNGEELKAVKRSAMSSGSSRTNA